MIFKQSFKDFEVIVVDSGSTDGALEVVKNYPVRVVTIAPQNFNYAKAANLGISKSHGDIIARLSGDAVPADKHWLEHLISPFKDPRVGATYGNQIGKGKNALELLEWHLRMGEKRRVFTKGIALGGPNMALRKSVWKKIPFDEAMPYGELSLWALATHQEGYKIVYEPKSRVIHAHGYRSYDFGDRKRTFIRRHILENIWSTLLGVGRAAKHLSKY